MVCLRESENLGVEKIIRAIVSNKIDDRLRERFCKYVTELIDMGCEQVIVGCSELSILASEVNERIGAFLLDPMKIIVDVISDEHDKR